MNTKNTKWMFGIALVAAAFGALALAGAASATMSGDVYGGSGTWTINNPTTLSDQSLSVSGSIIVNNVLTVTNASIVFTTSTSTISVNGPSGSLILGGASANPAYVSIGTDNAANYFNFSIASNAGTVKMQNVTIDNIWNGIRVNSGTQATRYFANVKITDAVNYGLYLTDSSAYLYQVSVALLISTTITETISGYNYSFVSDYGNGRYYVYQQSSQSRTRNLRAEGTAVYILRGSPYLDGVETHVPDVSQRIDISLDGTYKNAYEYFYSYGCPTGNDTYLYIYNTDYFYPFINVYGFQSQDALFANFNNVRPPPENFSFDIHWTFGGSYSYSYYYGGNNCQATTYTYPDNVYFLNGLYFDTANIVGVYVNNGGLTSINGQNYAMGRAGITIVSDYTGSQFAIDYFLLYYSRFPVVQSYSLWSVETKTFNTAAAVVNTDLSVTNSLFAGAGARIDRNYNYYAPPASGGANDTWFRGTILVDRVTVRDASAAGIDIRVTGYASQTRNQYDYKAMITNSSLQGSRPIALYLYNQNSISSTYYADVLIKNNDLSNGSFKPVQAYVGGLTVGLGGHTNNLLTDIYDANVVIEGNRFTNLTGPTISFDYSHYKFNGRSNLIVRGNNFTDVGYYAPPLPGGGKATPVTSDAFIKTQATNVTLEGNSFHNFSFVWGILGGNIGAQAGQEYLAFSYCALYNAANYGCDWPFKTPQVNVLSNTFEGTVMTGNTQYNAFVVAAGRGHILFQGNAINNSTASWVHALLNDYTYYAFPVVDIDITMSSNVISNQTGQPVGSYTHPFKAGNPFAMVNNTYLDSDAPFYFWRQGWYASMGYGVPVLAATMSFVQNTVYNVALGGEGVVRLTGSMTITNNSFDYVTGWCVIAEKMTKIPSLAGNSITHSTNGYWLAPAVVSGLQQTATYNDLTVAVTDTGIRVENGNLLMVRADFGPAVTAVDMRNGYAEIYSSKIGVLSGRVAGDASITVYNQLGYEVHWAGASGQDSGVLVKNALVVTSTPDQKILSSGHTDNLGRIPARTIEVWSMISFGATITTNVALPLTVLCFFGGITTTVSVPPLAPGELPSSFQDYDAYPLLLVDPIVPELTIGKPLAGETVGALDVAVEGYTFERGSGVATQRVRIDGGAWMSIPTSSPQWTITLSGLGEGRHFMEYEVTDVATNRFAGEREFFVDRTAPTLVVSQPLDEMSLSNQPIATIRGHVEPPTSIVALNGVTLTVNPRGDFFYNYSLSDGLNILRFTAMDAARNTVVIVRQVEFDRYAPFLQVSEPVNGLLTRERSVDVLGRSERDALVTVNGLPAFVSPIDGTFILPSVLLDDIFAQTENLLVIRASDDAGNVAFENRTVIVDTHAPSIDLEFPADIAVKIDNGEPVKVSSLNVRGTTDSTDAIITIGGQEVPLTGLSFGRVIVLREGLNIVVVTSEDEAGNQASQTLRITRDTVAPTLVLEKPEGSSLLTNQSAMDIVGYTDQADAVVKIAYFDSTLRRHDDQVQTVAVGLPIQYRFEFSLALVNDSNAHTVTVTATDLAGNFDSTSFDYTAKVNAPDLIISQFKDSTTDTFVWVNGTTSPGIDKVRINGQEFDVVAQGFSVRWNLPIQHGNYSFTVSVQDDAGNRNVWRGVTEVNVPVTGGEGPAARQGIFDSQAVQIGIGMLIFGVAIAVLGMTLMRRRQVD